MSDEDVVRSGYDELAEVFAESRTESPLETEMVEAFLDSLPEGARVLDAGCGQGEPVLTRLGGAGEGVGLDFSRAQLRRATAAVPAAAFAQGTMTTLPFPDGTFDAVTACHSIIHVPAERHQAVVDEFARVLRPGGSLLLTAGGAEWSGSNPDWLGGGSEMRWDMVGPERTRAQLDAAEFAVVDDGVVENGLAEEDGATFSFFVARFAE